MIRSDFEDARDCKCAAFEPEEKKIVDAIAEFYRDAADAGICTERTRDILRKMVQLEYLVQLGVDYETKQKMTAGA